MGADEQNGLPSLFLLQFRQSLGGLYNFTKQKTKSSKKVQKVAVLTLEFQQSLELALFRRK